MASSPPTVLILGHSFVRRLSSDLRSNFDARAAKHFNLLGDAVMHQSIPAVPIPPPGLTPGH